MMLLLLKAEYARIAALSLIQMISHFIESLAGMLSAFAKNAGMF